MLFCFYLNQTSWYSGCLSGAYYLKKKLHMPNRVERQCLQVNIAQINKPEVESTPALCQLLLC